MAYIKATEAKNHFGQLLNRAQRETVIIEKNGKSVAVMMSQETYDRLMRCEETLWALKANLAKKEGFYSEKESEEIIGDLLNAQD